VIIYLVVWSDGDSWDWYEAGAFAGYGAGALCSPSESWDALSRVLDIFACYLPAPQWLDHLIGFSGLAR